MKAALLVTFAMHLPFAQLVYGQNMPYGQKITVRTSEHLSLFYPCVISTPEDGFAVFWNERQNAQSFYKIYGRIYDSQSQPRTPEFEVSDYELSDQAHVAAAPLENGDIVVCWTRYHSGRIYENGKGDVYCRILDAHGKPRGKDFQINMPGFEAQFDQSGPVVMSFTAGGFVVAWHSEADGYSLVARIYNSMNIPETAEFQINPTNDNRKCCPTMMEIQSGNWMICWLREATIFCQRFTPTGIQVGDEFSIYDEVHASLPAVVELSSGGFIMSWAWSYFREILAQTFEENGARKASEFRVDSEALPAGYRRTPKLVQLPNDQLFVFWLHSDVNYRAPYEIYGQLIEITGKRKWSPFKIGAEGLSEFGYSVTEITKASFVMSWAAEKTIFAKILPKQTQTLPLKPFSLSLPRLDTSLNTTFPKFEWQQPGSSNEIYPWEVFFDLHLDSSQTFSHPQIIRNIVDTNYTITTALPAGKTYFWKVIAKNTAGDSLWSTEKNWGFAIRPTATNVENEKRDATMPEFFLRNHPNPISRSIANPFSTIIEFNLPSEGFVMLKVYSLLGEEVATLVQEQREAGEHRVQWQANDLPSGVYVYRLQGGDFAESKKLLLLR